MKKTFASLILFGACFSWILLPGCGGKDESGGLGPAIVDKADFIGRLDYRSMKEAPVSIYMEDERRRKDPSGKEEELLNRFREATGLEESDLLGILVSGSLQGVSLDPESPREYAESLDAALGISLDKTLSEDRFEAGLQLIVDQAGEAALKVVESEGKTTFMVIPNSPEEPTVHTTLAADGRAVYAALNEKSLAGILKREEKKSGRLSKDLQEAENGLPDGSQLKYAFIVPPSMREQIEAKISELEAEAAQNPGIGMIFGFIAPFKNLAGLSFGLRLSERVDLNLFADLGSESEALQAATLLQTMVVPFLKSQLARNGGGAMTDYEDRLTVGSEGRNLSLALQLSEADLEALNGQ